MLEVKMLTEVPKHKQSAEFYCIGGWNPIVKVTKGDRSITVGVNGEMHLEIPDVVNKELVDSYDPIRYGSDMDYYFENDFRFNQFLKTVSNAGFEVYRMNPWWEIMSDADPDGYMPDENDFESVLEQAKQLLDDEEYWSYLNE